jgi:hypothetical protein
MNDILKKILISLSMIVVGIFTIATSSIAIECYNKNADFKATKKSNFNFVIATLVMGILSVLSAFVIIFL